jgi:hypothetical protein
MRPIVFMWSPGDSCPRQRATNAAKVSAAPIALGIRGFGNGTDRKRVGVVRNRNNPNVTVQLRKTEDAVRELNLQVQVVEARTSEEFERAFTRLARGGCEWRRGARGPNCHRTWTEDRGACAGGPAADRFPALRNVEAGGLLSYGANITASFARRMNRWRVR